LLVFLTEAPFSLSARRRQAPKALAHRRIVKYGRIAAEGVDSACAFSHSGKMSDRKIAVENPIARPMHGMRRRDALVGLAITPQAAAMAGWGAKDIDDAVLEVLAQQQLPSASVAVVRDGALAYARAFGSASLAPRRPARPATAYALGSVSKSFTAALVALLSKDGLLPLDAPIARWRPDVPKSDQITLRHLLSHTSGLQDYFPQTGVPLALRAPADPNAVVTAWAAKGLEFPPGSAFRYSSTGFMLAGLIAEQVAQAPLIAQLRRRFFQPLGMGGAFDYDRAPSSPNLAQRYTRDAFQPPRATIREGAGWLFAAAGLAMTATDLARWNLGLVTVPGVREIAPPLFGETRLTDGSRSGYGLGFFVEDQDGRRKVSHDGQVSGFLAENRIYPDDGVAISVLVNTEVGAPNLAIADRIAQLVLPTVDAEARLARLLTDLRAGQPLSGLTEDAAAALSPPVRAAYRTSLSQLGALRSASLTDRRLRGGLVNRTYRLVFARGTAEATLRLDAAGRVEELVVWPWFA
jgi:CubicO group peptidase (beta-lactamase class C family)